MNERTHRPARRARTTHVGTVLTMAVVMSLLLCLSCSSDSARFAYAELSRIPFSLQKKPGRPIRGEELSQLVSMFPNAGSGQVSEFAGLWVSGAFVRLHRQDGSVVEITIDSDFRVWTEGNGDFSLSPSFKPLFDRLAPKERPTSAASTSAPTTKP
jgi:hypothetical protein